MISYDHQSIRDQWKLIDIDISNTCSGYSHMIVATKRHTTIQSTKPGWGGEQTTQQPDYGKSDHVNNLPLEYVGPAMVCCFVGGSISHSTKTNHQCINDHQNHQNQHDHQHDQWFHQWFHHSCPRGNGRSCATIFRRYKALASQRRTKTQCASCVLTMPMQNGGTCVYLWCKSLT